MLTSLPAAGANVEMTASDFKLQVPVVEKQVGKGWLDHQNKQLNKNAENPAVVDIDAAFDFFCGSDRYFTIKHCIRVLYNNIMCL